MTKFGRSGEIFVVITDDPSVLEATSECLYLRFNCSYCIQVEMLGNEKLLYRICIRVTDYIYNILKNQLSNYFEMKHIRVIPEEK